MPALYNPLDPQVRADPYATYREVRESDPVQFNPHAQLWFVARHADCARVLRGRDFSSRLVHRIRRRRDELPRSMLNTDPPDHARLRGPVAQLFGRRTIERIRARAAETAAALLAEVAAAAEADLIGDFARPLVTRSFVELFALPPDDVRKLERWICDASLNLDPLAPEQRHGAAGEASTALAAYFGRLIAARRRAPGDDLVSALLVRAGDALTDAELVTTLNLLLIGGHDPAVHLIGNGLLSLLRQPDSLQRLRDEPALVATAIEELLRFESPIQLAGRVAVADVELGGATVPRGHAVIALIGAANRDDSVFLDPDRLDVTRSPNPHLAFGGGAHLCLGGAVARALGQSAVEALLAALPRVRLVHEEPRWCASLVPRGLERLPVFVG
jgi:pimeloyl-[acyl-carrier protein] synthase